MKENETSQDRKKNEAKWTKKTNMRWDEISVVGPCMHLKNKNKKIVPSAQSVVGPYMHEFKY